MRTVGKLQNGIMSGRALHVTLRKPLALLLALLVVLMLSAACSKDNAKSASAGPAELEEALASGKPTLAGFVGKVCACKNISPMLEELAAEYEGRCSILTLDVDDNKDLFSRYNVTLAPTQVYFDSSGAEVDRVVGASTKEEVIERLKRMGVQ